LFRYQPQISPKKRRSDYTLEYGSGILEIHDDALTPATAS